MLNIVKKSLHGVFFSQNIFSFILYSYLISKAYDCAPFLYQKLSGKLKLSSAKSDVKYFGRFRLPISRGIFFRDTRASCLRHKEESCDDKDCLKKNLRYLYDLIGTAQREILVCCYTFKYDDLSNVIMEAHDRKVNVRVVADIESTRPIGAITSFRKKGIRIKMTETTFIVHHKFIIIDQTILINGSTNFTEKGILNNMDSLLVTSDAFFVEEYTKEFNYLWNTFKLTY